jgi:EAL domain-containing protein (putative c-di-GMP-specific phosphodiesterase class I)
VGALSDRAQERLALSGDLHEALDADALRLVYQPVMDLADGTVLGVEALVRWSHAARGEVPPASFVTVAEKTGLARTLDDWVLRRACREFAALHSAGVVPHHSHVAVNVTAASVVDASFATSVQQALDDAGLPPTCLVLEVTETGVMSDLDAGVRVLTAVHETGVRIAIDDFGTGWSSLTYVRRLPASTIKLDRSFVARLHEDDDDLAIAASVIDLGRATGMDVVAEGVETHEQLALLRRLGCAAGQGFLWHGGVPADELAAALGTARTVAGLPVQPTAREAPEPPVIDVHHGLERLWELHGEGASLTTIAAALNRDGYRTPTGQRWHSRTVARVLATPGLASSLSPAPPG